MAYKALNCPNCGGLIETFDETTMKGFCPYCDTIIVDVQERQNEFATNSQGAVKVSPSDFDIQGGILIRYRGESSSVIIPRSVSIIGANAFTGMRGITSVVMPQGVREIEDGFEDDHGDHGAFSGCTSLSRVTFPASLTYIGKRAFSGCSSLTTVQFPASLAYIGDNAFFNCSSLATVQLPPAPLKIGDEAFKDCCIECLRLPKGVEFVATTALGLPFDMYPYFSGKTGNTSRYFLGFSSEDASYLTVKHSDGEDSLIHINPPRVSGATLAPSKIRKVILCDNDDKRRFEQLVVENATKSLYSYAEHCEAKANQYREKINDIWWPFSDELERLDDLAYKNRVDAWEYRRRADEAAKLLPAYFPIFLTCPDPSKNDDADLIE